MTFMIEHTGAFLEIFHSSKDRIRGMPGCQHLELWQDASTPHIYCTYSHWKSEEALNAYRKSAFFGEVWPATKALFAAPAQAFSTHRVSE